MASRQNDVSFTVAQGGTFGVLDSNGAGKTTTMEIVEGFRTADSGSVMVLGMYIRQSPREVKASIEVQLQTSSLYPRLSACEALGFTGTLFPQSCTSR